MGLDSLVGEEGVVVVPEEFGVAALIGIFGGLEEPRYAGYTIWQGLLTDVTPDMAPLGDFPLIGFFANGEISRDRLYGHTGILTLFT